MESNHTTLADASTVKYILFRKKKEIILASAITMKYNSTWTQTN